MAEWLRSGLQSRVHRFDSGRRLSLEWINEIRELGNDANHEIVGVNREEAAELLTFVALLLQVVYEYPAKGKRRMEARQQRSE